MDWGIILDQRERANDYKGWKIHDKFKRSLGSLGDYICNQETFLNKFRPIKKGLSGTSILVTDIGDDLCRLQLGGVGDRFCRLKR